MGEGDIKKKIGRKRVRKKNREKEKAIAIIKQQKWLNI